MPKELIYQNEEYRDHPDARPAVRVGWSREVGHVEIATIMPDDSVLEPTPEGNGWFVQLTRREINEMIRVLRKARDQAFGRDE